MAILMSHQPWPDAIIGVTSLQPMPYDPEWDPPGSRTWLVHNAITVDGRKVGMGSLLSQLPSRNYLSNPFKITEEDANEAVRSAIKHVRDERPIIPIVARSRMQLMVG